MQVEHIGDTTLYLGDCLEIIEDIPNKLVDMILADPPYGTTACSWDSVIPLEPMWKRLKKVIKLNGAIVITSSQPFTSALIVSNIKMFKYCWIWQKDKGGNIGILKYQPSKIHEDICVFSNGTHNYYPIMDEREEQNKRKNNPRLNKIGIQGGKKFYTEKSKGNDNYKYPVSIRMFNSVRRAIHPTQKPVDLMEYLIKTYTNENEIVLDFVMGSGTTGVACANLGRKFIGIEKESKYFDIACKRIKEAYKQPRLL